VAVGFEKISIKKFPDLVVNEQYVSFLESQKLLDFDRLYHFSGSVIKQHRERTVVRTVTRMELSSATGKRTFYLKRHAPFRTCFIERIATFLGKNLSPGMSEFAYICLFRERGIATVNPVAAGERKVGASQYESFLITDSFEPYISLEDIIRKFSDDLQGKAGETKKRNLIRQVALMTRQIHDAGINHRDFNADHVLVSPFDEEGGFSLATYDLQRMDQRKWMRWKWGIKVMAEMSYTMPAPLFTEEDWLLLYQTYKGSQKLNMWDRLKLRIIRRKRGKISRHTDKIFARQRDDR